MTLSLFIFRNNGVVNSGVLGAKFRGGEGLSFKNWTKKKEKDYRIGYNWRENISFQLFIFYFLYIQQIYL